MLPPPLCALLLSKLQEINPHDKQMIFVMFSLKSRLYLLCQHPGVGAHHFVRQAGDVGSENHVFGLAQVLEWRRQALYF